MMEADGVGMCSAGDTGPALQTSVALFVCRKDPSTFDAAHPTQWAQWVGCARTSYMFTFLISATRIM